MGYGSKFGKSPNDTPDLRRVMSQHFAHVYARINTVMSQNFAHIHGQELKSNEQQTTNNKQQRLLQNVIYRRARNSAKEMFS